MHKITSLCPEKQTIDLIKEFSAWKLVYTTLLISEVIYILFFFPLYLILPVPSEDQGYDIFTISNVQMIVHGVYM